MAWLRRTIDRILPVGTRSVLWGVHQFLWHPVTAYRAWVALYGRPTWRELVCIIIHDWGYWGCPNMDGPEGTAHPELGARLAGWMFGQEYADLVLLHSRHYAKQAGLEPSSMCWSDKLSILYDPPWFYMLRARLSGEIKEYRQMAAKAGTVPLTASDWEWFWFVRDSLLKLAQTMDPEAVAYNPNGKMQSGGQIRL